MRLRDFFRMRAHFGWLYAALSRLKRPNTPIVRTAAPFIDSVLRDLDRRTQSNSVKFDEQFGTKTYGRLDVPVNVDPTNPVIWGYSAINHDFFREIMQSIPEPLSQYTFVDIGSGKGAAVLMASEYPFKHLVGVELNHELVDEAQKNVQRFNERTGKELAPEWSVGDFFQWQPPQSPCLFFFNNPFPEPLTLIAMQHLENVLSEHPYRTLLVFRKAPKTSGDYLNRSNFWMPLRLAPYWRVYARKSTS